MEKIYLKFYEEKTRKIHEDELSKISDYTCLSVSKDGSVELKKNCFIGRIDKKNAFAFLIREDSEDIFLNKTQANNLMDNDIILLELVKGKPVVKKIIKRGLEFIIATVLKNRKGLKYYTDKPLFKTILVDDESLIVSGSVVKLKVNDIKNERIYTKLEQVIGHIDDPDIDILKIVAYHNWPETDFDLLEKEANKLNININKEKEFRLDLTNDFIFTIDGADAKDLDDAVSLKVVDNNYHLGVHIADVSLYVKPRTLIDEKAYEKSTSVYMANKVIPMLPRKLANDLCSLNPDTDKLTVSCLMVINKDGKVIDYKIEKTIINSKARLTYDRVNDYLKNNIKFQDERLNEVLKNMEDLSVILKNLRNKRGALEFKTEELKFIFDKNNKVIDIELRKTDVAEELIESFMLIANETVAFHMEENLFPSIYRIHEKPDSEKLDKAMDTLSKLGLPFNKKTIVNAKELQKILKLSNDKDYENIVSMTLLRAMQKAEYSNNPVGHYGLAARYYTHFTSPIRRYPDLILHRIIKELVFGENNNKKRYNYYENNLSEIGKHTSAMERKAIEIEREVVSLKSCEYMVDKIGEEFLVQITQPTKTGFFVKTDKGIEGFVNVKNNHRESSFNEESLAFVIGGKIYKVGSFINVILTDVDMLDLKIDFKIK
ncbi:ribonuclease R [Haploplasma modicum]|uniref:ribonuclease R n=1 Tax=Haploplasma modicum TaxID=2150 RepID=UPI00047AE70B|nr:ribonuclease R [Haploplasma modicum]